MAHKPEQQLKELGSRLETPHSIKDALIKLLKQAATCLAELDQSPSASVLESVKPFLNGIVKPELLKHQDKDVNLLVAACLCEITRITAPEAPYSDDVLKDIFQLIVGTFSGLSDISGPSFDRRVAMLETLAKYRSCVVMLDLECDDLVNEMFSTFIGVARDDHPESVLSSMQNIMVVLLEESEDVREDLLSILLSSLGRENNDVTLAARRVVMNVIKQSAGKLEPSIKQFLLSSISEESMMENSKVEYHGVIYDLYCCSPQILSGVFPYLTGELLSDQLESRLKAVNLVGDIITLPGSIPEVFQPIFSEFLKRLTDRAVDVRMSVLEHVKRCLLSNPFRAEAPQIISSLCDRLLDYDENVRKQVVAVICDVACHSLNAVPLETVKLIAERLSDKSLLVKKYSMERLAEIYGAFCEKSSKSSVNPDEYDWIPGKILKCFYDKDFRSDIIESILCGSLFPAQFSINELVKRWIGIFSKLEKVEFKALEKVLEQKQRLQQEMQRYLSLRQTNQDKDVADVQKKILFCFRVMSRSFADPTKAEESFQILDQLKDANIWKILANLVDPNCSFHQALVSRDELLNILGEKHRLYDFLNTFSMKYSYLLFNKQHVKAILVEVGVQKSTENSQYLQSCMNILVIIARFSPLLLSGFEEDLVNLLKDSNDIIKEGVLHILAKAGGVIREQLAVTSSSIDLILERLCLEGSRRQAKHAVHALAAITKDDGLKSLSVLYKRLVDMLEENKHLPAVLQSLGCIAETAMPVFETRESEIEDFIVNKILKSDSKEDNKRASWDDKSDICMLKIYGIKTLVKSYLPVKDAHVRPGIGNLLDILRNMLSYGEISEGIQSSSVDKAQLKLASAKAVLRLSKLWDHNITVDIFHLTLRISEISFPQARKIFLNKAHQYMKDQLLDAKYACAFLFNIFGSNPDDFAEDRQNLADIIQMHHQAKAGQHSVQSDSNSWTAYPEYILPYLVHALAHISCPNIDDCKDLEAYDNIYRQLHLILSFLVHRDEDAKLEATTNEEEILSTITSIFQGIKHSEDVVDISKSKNSHAICDLGLAITKRLLQKDVDLQGLASTVSLPQMLYKACEKEGDVSVVGQNKTWLADESALAHFESLELEMVPSHSAKDDAPKDNERDGKKMTLAKSIKNRRTKGKTVKKNKPVSAEIEKAENDIDVLSMVRQINLDNLGISTKFESSNGHENSLGKKAKKETEYAINKKRKAGELSPVPVPKRKRSSTHGSLRSSSSTSMGPRRVSEDSPDAKLPFDAEVSPDRDSRTVQRKVVKGSNLDLKVSTLKQKAKGFKISDNDEANNSDEHGTSPDNQKQTDKTTTSNCKSSTDKTGSTKKRKRKSIAGLAKCTSKQDDINTEELIGRRIKVWWPMDKQFYEGTVKSYDSLKGKHVILYDDGDVEVLRLDKERWELVGKDRKPTKKMKPSKALSSLDVSIVQKHRSSSGFQRKKSKKIINGKRSPIKKVKRGEKGELKINIHQEDAKESSEISNPEEVLSSKSDEMNSGESEGEPAEWSAKTITKEKKYTKKGIYVSRGKNPKKEKRLSDTESDQEKQENDYPEGDQAERSDEIMMKEKISTKKVRSVSRVQKPKGDKSLSRTEESDQEKLEYGDSEGEPVERSDEIITQQKESTRKRKSVSAGKKPKKEKKLNHTESDQEKLEYGISAGESAERSYEIITKEKKSSKKEKPVSREKKQQKKSHAIESEQDKEKYGERLSEDGASVPQDVENVGEVSISGEIEAADEPSGAFREKDDEKESDSGGNQDNSDTGSSPREMEKSHIQSSCPIDAGTNEIPDDEPLVNYSSKWKRRTGKKSSGLKG